MAIGTYSELQTAIGDWLNRDDLTTVIPNFIVLAEASFNRQLRTRQMVTRLSITTGQQFTDLPADFLELKNVQINAGRVIPLSYVSMEMADQLRALTPTGIPRSYSIVGNTIELVPVPSSDQVLELAYFARIPALSGGNTTNWLLTSAPDLYLHGALMQSAPYLRDDERIATWSTLYERVLTEVQRSDDRADHSGSTLVVRSRMFN